MNTAGNKLLVLDMHTDTCNCRKADTTSDLGDIVPTIEAMHEPYEDRCKARDDSYAQVVTELIAQVVYQGEIAAKPMPGRRTNPV